LLPQSALPPAGAATAASRVLEVSGPGEELLLMLFPRLRGLRILRVEDTGEAVAIRGVLPGCMRSVPVVRGGVGQDPWRVCAGGG
jgi:hypothetical protein